MVQVDSSTSENSWQPFVYEMPCGKKFDDDSALIEHRKSCRGSKKTSNRSRKAARDPYPCSSPVPSKPFPGNVEASCSAGGRASVAIPQNPTSEQSSPQVGHHTLATTFRQAPEPPYNAGPQATGPEAKRIASTAFPCHAANYHNTMLAHLYGQVALQPLPAQVPLGNGLPSHLPTLHGEESDAQESSDVNTILRAISQYNHSYPSAGVSRLPYPILPNNPPTVSHRDSESFYTTSSDLAHTSTEPTHNAAIPTQSFIPSMPEVESIDSGSAATCPTNHWHGSPPTLVEQPFDKNVFSEVMSLHNDVSNDNGFVGNFAVQWNDASSLVTGENNHAYRSFVPRLPPPSFPIVPPKTNIDDYSACDDAKILSDFEIKIHEDEIFFRGTGREGCLCPEMMIHSGAEGWDRSVLDTHKARCTRPI